MSLVKDLVAEGHIPYLVDRVNRRMQADLADAVRSEPFPELRGSHFRVLALIPPEGARPSVLADAAMTTRPALGELIRHLEATGYLQTVPDPTDRRAVIVRHTARGRRANAAVAKGVAKLRASWEREIGADALADLVRVMVALCREPGAE